MNRNHTRVLSDEQIKDITSQVADDLRKYSSESAEALINCYLNGDAEGMFDMISDWIETAEDEVRRQLNHDLNEDSFDNYSAHYEI